MESLTMGDGAHRLLLKNDQKWSILLPPDGDDATVGQPPFCIGTLTVIVITDEVQRIAKHWTLLSQLCLNWNGFYFPP